MLSGFGDLSLGFLRFRAKKLEILYNIITQYSICTYVPTVVRLVSESFLSLDLLEILTVNSIKIEMWYIRKR